MQAKLEPHFEIVKARTIVELRDLAKNHVLFCTLIVGAVQDEGDLREIGKIRSALARTPFLFYGNVRDRELASRLIAEAGMSRFVEYGNGGQLLQELNKLNTQATFRISPKDFGVDLDQCSLWTKRFFDIILKDHHFLKHCVARVAATLKTSVRTLERALNSDNLFCPEQWLLCFRHYYAAYLLTGPPSRCAKYVAEDCGFTSVPAFHRSFSQSTGITPGQFRKEKNWRRFPDLYLKNRERKANNQPKDANSGEI